MNKRKKKKKKGGMDDQCSFRGHNVKVVGKYDKRVMV